jgi:hypothetical protein
VESLRDQAGTNVQTFSVWTQNVPDDPPFFLNF